MMQRTKLFSIEQLVNSNLIKYERLAFINRSLFNGYSDTCINIFIDMNSVTKALRKSDLYAIDEHSTLTTCIINMVAHYREFYDKIGVETIFYIVDSDNIPNANRLLHYEYNEKSFQTMKVNRSYREMMEYNRKLLNILCPYLPNIHYVSSTFETGAMILDIILNNQANGNDNMNIIITKDIYNYQLCSAHKTVVFRPKKKNGEDLSYGIDITTVMTVFCLERKIKNPAEYVDIHPRMLGTILALSRVPERGIVSLLSITKALQVTNSIILNQVTINPDIGYVYDVMQQNCLVVPKVLAQYVSRAKVCDLYYQQLMLMNSVESSSKRKFDNLYDPDGVKTINNQYFRNKPLDLNRL